MVRVGSGRDHLTTSTSACQLRELDMLVSFYSNGFVLLKDGVMSRFQCDRARCSKRMRCSSLEIVLSGRNGTNRFPYVGTGQGCIFYFYTSASQLGFETVDESGPIRRSEMRQ